MSKPTVVRWWKWSWVPIFVAGVLIPSGIAGLAAHGSASDGYGKTMIALIALGGVSAWCGFVLQVVSWAGAVLNTKHLSDESWFRSLVLIGVIGILTIPMLGLGALAFEGVLMAYVVAGPDGLSDQPRVTTPDKKTIRRWNDGGLALAGVGLVGALVVSRLTDSGALLHGHTWLALALVSAGIGVAVLGAVMIGAAYWGALFNAQRLTDQTWFRRLRSSGILATLMIPIFGLGALIAAIMLIAYQHSAPDSIAPAPPQPPSRTHPSKLAPGH